MEAEIVPPLPSRLLTALVEAETAPPLPYMPDVLQLQLEHNILKSQMVDYLRQQETYIAQQQLLARLHERRLAGGMVLGQGISEVQVSIAPRYQVPKFAGAPVGSDGTAFRAGPPSCLIY